MTLARTQNSSNGLRTDGPARRVRARLLATTLGVLLIASALIALCVGPVPIDLHSIMLIAIHHTGMAQNVAINDSIDVIVWQVRLPRIILEVVVGGALAAAGVAFQALLRNDLAEPYTTGVSGGASVGWGLVTVAGLGGYLGGHAATLAAFVGGLLTLVAVYAMARIRGRMNVQSMLLSGVVMGAFLWSVQMILLKIAGKSQDEILGWLMGSLSSANWDEVTLLIPIFVACVVLLASQTYTMNVYSLGEESAKQLGVDTEQFKRLMMVAGALLTAATVSVAGIIGFVGLIVPHLVRRMAGTSDNRVVLASSVLGGALILIWADTISRTALTGEALPVGVITALIGCPFFFYLLRLSARKS